MLQQLETYALDRITGDKETMDMEIFLLISTAFLALTGTVLIKMFNKIEDIASTLAKIEISLRGELGQLDRRLVKLESLRERN